MKQAQMLRKVTLYPCRKVPFSMYVYSGVAHRVVHEHDGVGEAAVVEHLLVVVVHPIALRLEAELVLETRMKNVKNIIVSLFLRRT